MFLGGWTLRKKEVIWVHPILPDRRALSATQWNPWSGCTGGVKPGGYVSLAEGWNFSSETNEKMGRTIKVLQTEEPLRTVLWKAFSWSSWNRRGGPKFSGFHRHFSAEMQLATTKRWIFWGATNQKKDGAVFDAVLTEENFHLGPPS